MSSASVIEAILLRWGETHSTGRTVTFLLPDDGGEHPFKSLKCGPDNGQRVALSVALIADDETQRPAPAPEPKPAKERKSWSELPLSQQAAIRCGEAEFETFMRERYAAYPGATIAEIVREACGVDSRRDIHPDKASGGYWRAIDSDYRFWLSQRGPAP